MRLHRSSLSVLLLSSALAVGGCRRDIEAENEQEREQNRTKVTADSTDDATETIVDSDFGFRLTLPGSGWKLLRGHDARSLNPDAIAGAINPLAGVYGIIIVEQLPGTTLEQVASLLWQQQLPGQVVESEHDIEFQGLPAKQRAFAAEVQGQRFWFVSTLILRDDHLYQLMSWSMSPDDRALLLAFQNSVELLDGPVKGQSSQHEPITHADGVGWRIREGRYESALNGLRLRLPEGWRFVVGLELERLGSDAEIVATREQTNTYVALTTQRASKSRLEDLAALTRRSFMNGQAPIGEPFTRELAGQPVEFRHYEMAPLEFISGVHIGDDAITTVAAWYPQAMSESALADVDAVLAGLDRVPDDERDALHEQLLELPNRQQRLSTDRVFRAGELLDFQHQVRWTMPPGFWFVESFDKALTRSAENKLTALELEHGVFVALEIFAAPAGQQPSDVLEALIEGDELLSRDTTVVDGLTVHRASWIDRSADSPMRYAIAITRRDDLFISMIATAINDSRAAQAAMQAALTRLDYTPELDRTRLVGRQYTDNFYGLSFAVPRMFEGPPAIQDLGLGQVAAWTKGKQELVSLAFSGPTDDEQWMSSYFEQILRDVVGHETPLGKPERSQGTLGGHPARQLTWTANGANVHAQIVVRDPLVYCMLYANLSDAQREQVQASWTLLE